MIPPRILDDDPTEAEARLLQASRKYRAPDKIRRTTLAAVSAVAGTTMAAGTATPAARTHMWFAAKLLVGALAASAFFATQAQETRNQSRAPEAALAAERAPVPAMPASAAPPIPVPTEATAVEPARAPVPSARPARHPTAPRRAPAVAATGSEEDLAAEIAAVDKAKRALEQKDANAALATLDEHRRRFRNGALAPEAAALRIEALMARGQEKAARKLAEAFLVEHPTSPLAPRIRDLVGAGSKAPGRAPDDSTSSP